jgi:phospholipid transport system substrate-binding protein
MKKILSTIVILTGITSASAVNADMISATSSSLVAAPISGNCTKTSSAESVAEYQVASAEFNKDEYKAAQDFISNVSKETISGIFSKPIPYNEKEEKFSDIFTESIDLPTLSKFVLGRYWKASSEMEKREFIKIFSELNIKTWARRFNDYAGLDVKTVGVTPSKTKGQFFVESKIEKGSGEEPITVSWRVMKKTDGYKIIDIIVEGSSMARTYRNEYRSVIKNSGKGVQGLIDTLKIKVKNIDNEEKSTASDDKSVKNEIKNISHS